MWVPGEPVSQVVNLISWQLRTSPNPFWGCLHFFMGLWVTLELAPGHICSTSVHGVGEGRSMFQGQQEALPFWTIHSFATFFTCLDGGHLGIKAAVVEWGPGHVWNGAPVALSLQKEYGRWLPRAFHPVSKSVSVSQF